MEEHDSNKLYEDNQQLIGYWIDKKYGKNLAADLYDDLYSAGNMALYQAAQNFDPDNESEAQFSTFASAYIQMSFIKVWEERGKSSKRKKSSKSDKPGDTVRPRKLDEFEHPPKKQSVRFGKKERDRIAVQILDVMRMWSDEKHTLTQQDIALWHFMYCYEKYGFQDEYNRSTYTTTIKNMLLEDKIAYEENDQGKLTGLYYKHLFSYREMDKLIGAVCLSDMLSYEEKSELVKKILSTASEYYRSPFWDRGDQKLLFNPKGAHGRLSKKSGESIIAENYGIIQKAIFGKNLISFKFNHYTKTSKLEPNKDKDGNDRIYTLRPYHLVVYHDNYYCLGFHEGSSNIFHYRVDLMSDIAIVVNDKGKPIRKKTIPISDYKFTDDFWDPETYMAEHIYMAYGEPRDIEIKIDNHDQKGFTFLHDWFGEHFKVIRLPKGADPDYIFASVKADPKMIVHWAMQYSGLVEVMDEEVRALIKEELERMREKYE
jgi:hypothetical protein